MPKITISLDDLSPQILAKSDAALSGLTELGVDLQNFESLNNAFISRPPELAMMLEESGIITLFTEVNDAITLEVHTALYQYMDTNTSLHGLENFFAISSLYELHNFSKSYEQATFAKWFFDNEVAEIIKFSPSTFPDQFDALVAELRADLSTHDASLA